MIKKVILVMIFISIISLVKTIQENNKTTITSPYSGQEKRTIKSLSEEDVNSLENGTGVAFGGLAKLAELNGSPGPRHVLDMEKELQLTSEQKDKMEKLFQNMKQNAIKTGKEIIDVEKAMNNLFATGRMNEKELKDLLDRSSEKYSQLRYVHLEAHLKTVDILTPEQVSKYNELRGYSSANEPCKDIPEGHDPIQWKKHNNCD